MNGRKSVPHSQETFSGSSTPGAESTNCIGLNGTTMQNQKNVVLTQSTRPLNRVLPESDFTSLPSFDNDEITSKPEKPSRRENSATVNYRHAPGKHNFARHEAAHQQSIWGSVLIHGCILKRKPHVLRLVQQESSGPELAASKDDIERQALQTPVAPVNKETMKELEIGAIQNNTSLRIDLCFDDQLFFQPIKGLKQEEKRRRARIFWDCLSLELQEIRHALQGNCPDCAKEQGDCSMPGTRIPSRLAVFFSALRDLIGMLVPDKDKEEILTKLEVDDLVRLSRVGHFDAVEFSTWLAQLLMTHCAPLRDGMARQMNQQISDGAKANDMDLLVKGLETLLSLLENMKLDVANHQVRSFKLLLIADTVPFLQDCFSKMRDDQQIDLKSSRRWFKDLRKKYRHQKTCDFDVFVCGAVALCRSPFKLLPTTFSYDKDRISCLRHEVLDLTQLRICMSTFEELALAHRGRRPTAVELEDISDRFLQLIYSEDGTNEIVACHMDEIATEIARAVNAMSAGAEPRAYKQGACKIDVQRAIDRLDNRLENEQFSVLDEVIEELTERTVHYTSRFQKLDTLQISNAQRLWSTTRSMKNFVPAPDIEDIARRLAHIIIIHWSVWVNIAYLEDDESNLVSK